MSQQPTPAGGPQPGPFRSFVGGFTAGTLITALVGLFAIDSVRDDVCGSLTGIAERRLPGCGEQFEPISSEDATEFLIYFYGRAGGAQPDAAWREMLTPEAQNETASETFEDLWAEVDWAELRGPVRIAESDFNTFEVGVRYYYADGEVVTRKKSVTLRVVDGEPMVDADTAGRRTELEFLEDARGRLVRSANTYHEPREDADIAMFADEVDVGGTLVVLCALRDETGQPEWFRTPQGWISAGVLEVTHPLEGLTCDPVYRDV